MSSRPTGPRQARPCRRRGRQACSSSGRRPGTAAVQQAIAGLIRRRVAPTTSRAANRRRRRQPARTPISAAVHTSTPTAWVTLVPAKPVMSHESPFHSGLTVAIRSDCMMPMLWPIPCATRTSAMTYLSHVLSPSGTPAAIVGRQPPEAAADVPEWRGPIGTFRRRVRRSRPPRTRPCRGRSRPVSLRQAGLRPHPGDPRGGRSTRSSGPGAARERGRGRGSGRRAGSGRAGGPIRSKATSKLRVLGLYAPTCWAVTTQSNATPSLGSDAANRSSSQFVMTPSLKRSFRRARAAAESGNAGHSPTEPENASISSAVGSTPYSAVTPRRAAASTSR